MPRHRSPAYLLPVVLATLSAPSSLTAQQPEVLFTTSEGTWVALDVSRGGETLLLELLGDIYLLPSSGGQAEPILTGPAFQSQPRFSPDGSAIVYVSDGSGSDNVWIATADGQNARALTDLDVAGVLSPAWSADGSSVFATVIKSMGFRSEAELWRFDVTSGRGVRVVENRNGPSAPLVSAPVPGPYGAAPHPDGTKVYYTSVTPRPYGSRDGAKGTIETVDLESGEVQHVVVESTMAMKPGLTPDGRRLVYAGVREGRTGLKVRDLETGGERWLAYPIQRHQLEGRATRDVLPNFSISPDSRWLFAAWNGRIHRIDLETGDDQLVPFEATVRLAVEPRLKFPRRVEQGPVMARRAQQLAVSKDGRSALSALGRIWLTDSSGTSPRRLTSTTRPREFMPAWSADGQWVAFVTWDETGGRLWRARADGRGDPIALSDRVALWADPVWTPDGTGVVALRAPLGSTLTGSGPGADAVPEDADLVFVSISTGEARRIAKAGNLRRPHFGPEADRVYLSGAGLHSVSLAGGELRVEARTDAELRLSPDGASVLAIAGPSLSVHPVPGEGLSGEALSSPARTLAVSADAPGLVAWSDHGSRVAAIAGRQLMRTELSDISAPPTVVPIEVSVPRAGPDGAVVLRGGTVVSMRGDEIVADADVVVAGNRIVGIGPTGSIEVPSGASEIDVRGKHIVPGFIDLHAHFSASGELPTPESTVAFANLAYGITTLRNPQASPDVFALADLIEADGIPGPRVLSTGPGLFSPMDFSSLEAARASIQRYPEVFGTHLLKWYMAGSRGERRRLVEAARGLQLMPTTEGGADTKADLTYAMDGFSGLEHAFPVAPIHDDIVQLFAHTGITYTPTLVVAFGAALPVYRLQAEIRPHEDPKARRWFPDGDLYASTSSRLLWFPPEDYNDRDAAEGAAAILAAGGRVALGGHGELQGLSNHWEMALLSAGGMSNHDILRVATIHGAEAIGYEQDLGSLEPGKLADLVVMNRDPLDDIRATQDIAFVMKNGVLYEGETLDEVWPDPGRLARPWWLDRPTEPAAAVAMVEDVVRETMRDGRIPGLALAVVRDGEVLLSRGFGVADIETDSPVSDRTLFQSGSLGKQWTAAGIMALVEDGRIDLDASIRTYLDEAPTSWQPITVRHLLTHSSGIPDYTSDEFDYETDYTEEDLVRMASGLTLEFPAGTRWNYSNTGYVMLGVAMSRVTDRPYWEFLNERIFDPAGMPTIRVNTQRDIVLNRAQGYLPTEDGWEHPGYVAPLTNTTADGSMLISLRDLIAWNEVVSNRTVLSEESWEKILSPMTLNSGRAYPYGFGWFLEKAGGQDVHQHGGTWQGFVTQYTRYVGDDLAVIVLANARSLAVPRIATEVATVLNPEVAPPPPPTAPIPDPDPEATRYVADMLAKIARGELELGDFDFVRQTIFPRMRAALTAQLEGRGAPDRIELLASEPIGDDRSLQYWAWYGDRRIRVLVSLGPQGGLTALRLIPERS